MAEIYLDIYSLYHLAIALRERSRSIDSGCSITEANAVFEKSYWMPYDPTQSITVLEDHPNLNETLILLLEARFSIDRMKKGQVGYDLAYSTYSEMCEKYEFLLKMTDSECRSLMIER